MKAPAKQSQAGQQSVLARALAPLFRAYLRRLDEMAARLPGDALACEMTTRDDDGKLLLGEDGLPLRYDVADRSTGETYEVRGAKPDAPAEAEVRVGPLVLRLLPGNWEAMPLACAFDGTPVPEDAEELANLIRAWAVLAAHGAFAHTGEARGTKGAERWSGRIHAVSIQMHGDELRAQFDLGTCPPAGLDALIESLAGFGLDRAPVAWATLGGAAPDKV